MRAEILIAGDGVLGLSLAAALNAPILPTKFGLFRM